MNALLFSTNEIDVLRLLRWCRNIPRDALLAVFPHAAIQPLLYFKLITLYKKQNAYVLTGAGNRFLNDSLSEIPPAVRPSYKEEDYLRRSRVSRFALTAYRAGLSVFHTELSALEENGALYLTAQSRVKGMNPWGSTRTGALLRMGNTISAVHYVCDGIGKLSLIDEKNAFLNNTARIKEVVRAWTFTGASCEDIYGALGGSESEPEAKLVTYGELFRRNDLPVYLIPHSLQGALQLNMMLQPDYRSRMARIALSDYHEAPPKEHPEWDAMYRGVPLIMAADMDLKRLDTAARSAAQSRYGPTVFVALKGQEKVLALRYKRRGLARSINTFKPEVLDVLTLYTPPNRQFETTKGDVIHAPSFPVVHKADGSPQR